MSPAATSNTADRLRRLGDLTIRQFLARHWQRQPLLIRNDPSAPPHGASVAGLALTQRELFALARDPDVESRLVFSPGSVPAGAAGREATDWRLRHGPFNRLPPRRHGGWSLLVQGVDLHLESARALMDRFRFIPDARLDDLMISFATDGGGVGPHVDSYDVFLLQIEGRRRWRIAPPAPVTLLPDAPLRILADFEPQQSWLLEPGDMLYLPPGWAHEGTAVGDCMTCSIGFRSPSVTELRRAFFGFLADDESAAQLLAEGAERRYRDRTREPAMHPAEIPEHMATTLQAWLRGYKPPAQLIERFLGCYLTEPKPSVWFESPQLDRSPEANFRNGRNAAAVTAPEGGPALALDRKTRMLYRGRAVYINGEATVPPAASRVARSLLRQLADRRGLDAAQSARALREPWLRDRIGEWLANGWLRRAGS